MNSKRACYFLKPFLLFALLLSSLLFSSLCHADEGSTTIITLCQPELQRLTIYPMFVYDEPDSDKQWELTNKRYGANGCIIGANHFEFVEDASGTAGTDYGDLKIFMDSKLLIDINPFYHGQRPFNYTVGIQGHKLDICTLQDMRLSECVAYDLEQIDAPVNLRTQYEETRYQHCLLNCRRYPRSACVNSCDQGYIQHRLQGVCLRPVRQSNSVCDEKCQNKVLIDSNGTRHYEAYHRCVKELKCGLKAVAGYKACSTKFPVPKEYLY